MLRTVHTHRKQEHWHQLLEEWGVTLFVLTVLINITNVELVLEFGPPISINTCCACYYVIQHASG